MRLKEQIDRWTGAGLIEPDQGRRILAFEADRGRPILLYAISGLGAFAIATGLVAVIAANWDGIPDGLKITADLLLVAGLGTGVVAWSRRGPTWVAEVALVVYYGLVLASVALISQVYQLGGHAREGLLIWSVLTAVIMMTARSGIALFLWVAGLQTTIATWLVFAAEKLPDQTSVAVLPVACGVVLGFLALGRSSLIAKTRPRLARILHRLSWTELVIAASLGTFAFYSDTREHFAAPAMWIGSAGALIGAGGIALWSRREAAWPKNILLFTCVAFALGPLLVSPGALGLLAALLFIGLWLVVAWAARATDQPKLVNLATAVIGVRIVSIYVEVFGRLLDTGLGLIGGGLLTILLVYLWLRAKKNLAGGDEP